MTLKERIEADMKEAMRSSDRLKLSVLRMIRARILEREVELRSSRGRDYHLSDEEVVDVLQTYAKQRKQSIDSYRQGKREDLASKEEQELAVVETYLPRPLTESEIEALVKEAMRETEAKGLGDLGKVMKTVMPRIQGRAEGRIVNEIARRCLVGG